MQNQNHNSIHSIMSPCNGFCLMDQETKFCKGCFRTIGEIVNWQFMSDDKKNDLLKLIESRKEQSNFGN